MSSLADLHAQHIDELEVKLRAKTMEAKALLLSCGKLLGILRDVWAEYATTDEDGDMVSGGPALDRVRAALLQAEAIYDDTGHFVDRDEPSLIEH